MSIRQAALPGIAILLTSSVGFADVPNVAADIPPIHSLVATVMGDLGEPDLIVSRGSSPHDYAMRPSEAEALQDADAIFWVGEPLEPWLAGAIRNLAAGTDSISLLDVQGTTTHEFRQNAVFASDEDHAHGHDHNDEVNGHSHGADHDHSHENHGHEGHDHGGHGHSHDGLDPHAWLDPSNGKIWLDTIAATLSDLDPENAETYSANSEVGKSAIDVAVDAARETLAPVGDLRFVVFHDAYQYYETFFDLRTVGAIELSDASGASAARLQQIRDAIKERDVSCVFAEPQFNPGLVETVISETETRQGVIDPLGSDISLGSDFYPGLIRGIAEDIAECGA
ncbi:zinc ABC transporter substrate-binding protein [Palleronia sp. LCG004]|uniref:zinc ABC transporter substrate-binding protein n=1 Tax=Palleronia sp. LCG004 TaxID=3079304 RepID=UPI002941E008|nr:zinc ABC transporter substrate-binding protein [Palleronia sp. LCG004]WOI57197.1 zinc ABC transporter substrate-binding protein [Palleronia sp. LCG004]